MATEVLVLNGTLEHVRDGFESSEVGGNKQREVALGKVPVGRPFVRLAVRHAHPQQQHHHFPFLEPIIIDTRELLFRESIISVCPSKSLASCDVYGPRGLLFRKKHVELNGRRSCLLGSSQFRAPRLISQGRNACLLTSASRLPPIATENCTATPRFYMGHGFAHL